MLLLPVFKSVGCLLLLESWLGDDVVIGMCDGVGLQVLLRILDA